MVLWPRLKECCLKNVCKCCNNSKEDKKSEKKESGNETPPAVLKKQKSVEELAQDFRKIEMFFGTKWADFIQKARIPILGEFVQF